MGLKDLIARARSGVTGALGPRRSTIDRGADKLGDDPDTGTSGRYKNRIRKGTDRVRARLAENDPGRREDPDDPDGPVPARTGPR